MLILIIICSLFLLARVFTLLPAFNPAFAQLQKHTKQALKIVLLTSLILGAAYCLFSAYAQALAQLQDRTSFKLHTLGYQFMGLENVFKDVRTVGYYTDKDLKNTIAIAQFEQAQYMLAPTVLDLNHTQYHFVIFDCSSPQVAMDTIKNLGFTPLKARFGIILAYNPNGI